MWLRLKDIRLLVVIVVSVAVMGVLACGGAAEEPVAAPAPAPVPAVDTEALGAMMEKAIKALPAPELDLTKLRSLVEQSVKASVPEGTNAAEIQRMVEAAVTAASANVATRGDMEAAVSKSVKEAAAGQLTAAEVQKIVDASLAATEAAATKATMAVKQAEVAAMAIAKGRTDPRLLARTTKAGQVTYVWDGPIPTKFNEAPMSAELVKAGKLPPVEERLPDEPGVVPPNEAIGLYGGTWRKHYNRAGDSCSCGTGGLTAWDGDGSRRIPHMAKDLQLTDGGRVLTMTLRKGQKWSNGDPFTSEDFRFTWEDLGLNKDFSPVFDSKFLSPISGNPAKFEVVDNVTLRWTFDDPNYEVAEVRFSVGGHTTAVRLDVLFSPSAYLKQFHPKYASKADLDKEMKAAELDSWIRLLKAKVNHKLNVDKPTTSAWKTVDDATGVEWILERNHYYYAVDPAGNQLPYIDRIHLTLVEDLTAGSLKAAAGEIDYQGRNLVLGDVPLYEKNAKRGNFYVFLRACECPSDGVVNMNQSFVKDPVIGDLLRTRDFRRALSLAMDRNEVNEIIFLGTGVSRAFVPAPGTLYYPGEKWEKMFTVRDVAEANRLLDNLVLPDGSKIDKKDVDGIRLRPDGKGPLTLHFDLLRSYLVDYGPMADLLKKHWAEAGIGVTWNATPTGHKVIQANEGYLFIWESRRAWSPWIGDTWTIPNSVGFRSAVEIGRYFTSDGKGGEPATVAKYAGADGNYPFKLLQDWHREGKVYPMDSPERIELGKTIFKLHATEVIHIGTIGGTGAFKGVAVVKNNLRNVPKNVGSQAYFSTAGPRIELHYFESPIEEGQRSPWRSN